MHKACSSIKEKPYCFSRLYVKLRGHTAKKIVKFDPDWAFPDFNSSLNSLMDMKWYTSQYLNQWWHSLLMHISVNRPRGFNSWPTCSWGHADSHIRRTRDFPVDIWYTLNGFYYQFHEQMSLPYVLNIGPVVRVRTWLGVRRFHKDV